MAQCLGSCQPAGRPRRSSQPLWTFGDGRTLSIFENKEREIYSGERSLGILPCLWAEGPSPVFPSPAAARLSLPARTKTVRSATSSLCSSLILLLFIFTESGSLHPWPTITKPFRHARSNTALCCERLVLRGMPAAVSIKPTLEMWKWRLPEGKCAFHRAKKWEHWDLNACASRRLCL